MNTLPTGFGPPPGVSPTDLWTRLTTTPRPFRDIKFPRRGVEAQVRIVVLTEQELMTCRATADRFAKEQLREKQAAGDANLGYQEIYKNECVVQLVCAACRDASSESISSRAFPSPDMARQHMTADEFAFLFSSYCDWQAESGPLLSQMTAEEKDAWVDRLIEAGNLLPLEHTSSVTKNDLLLHSVLRLAKLRKASTSYGTPPSSSSPEASA